MLLPTVMDDTDGFVYVALDEVDLSGMRNPRASIWVHLEGSNYEPTDAIRVWATTRLCGEIEIIRAPPCLPSLVPLH